MPDYSIYTSPHRPYEFAVITEKGSTSRLTVWWEMYFMSKRIIIHDRIYMDPNRAFTEAAKILCRKENNHG